MLLYIHNCVYTWNNTLYNEIVTNNWHAALLPTHEIWTHEDEILDPWNWLLTKAHFPLFSWGAPHDTTSRLVSSMARFSLVTGSILIHLTGASPITNHTLEQYARIERNLWDHEIRLDSAHDDEFKLNGDAVIDSGGRQWSWIQTQIRPKYIFFRIEWEKNMSGQLMENVWQLFHFVLFVPDQPRGISLNLSQVW